MTDAVNDSNNMVLIVRLDERTKQIIDLLVNNDKVHESIIAKLDKLTVHVNHENELMDKRMTTVELVGSPTVKDFANRLSDIENWMEDQESQKKGANFVLKISVGILGVALSIITILLGLRLI